MSRPSNQSSGSVIKGQEDFLGTPEIAADRQNTKPERLRQPLAGHHFHN